MNPTEYKIMLQAGGDAETVAIWSVLDLLEISLKLTQEE